MLKKVKSNLRRHPTLFNFAKNIYHKIKIVGYPYLRKDTNYFKCYSSAKSKLEESLGKPILLTLEPTNICNLKCPICETGSGELNREPQMMKFEEFKYILDQFDECLKILYLYYMGESFLNRDIYKMIRYASDRGLYVSICTNGEFVNPQELIHSGIAEIQFQIGGITQEIHNIYRKGGNLSKTLEILRGIVEMKKKYLRDIKQERYPLKIALGFILMKQNEYQIEEFIKIAKEIGVDEYQLISSCVRNIEQAKEFLPSNKNYWIYDYKAFQNGKLKVKNTPDNYCEWIYSTVTIQVNGDVVPCCRDVKGEYILGNIFKDNIYDIWNNEKMKQVRKTVGVNQKKFTLCKLCEGYTIPQIR